MKLKLILFLMSALYSQYGVTINWEKVPNITVGTEVGFKSVSVIEKDSQNDELAKMSKGLSIAPSVIISSNDKYVWEDDNWGYHVQVKGGWFTMNKQTIDEQTINLGTQLKGFSLYAVPVGYYHFNKHITDNWNYKLGLGAGLGWLSLEGDAQITKRNHALTDDNIAIDSSGLGTAIGVFFEAEYNNHSIVLQNYSPQIYNSSSEFHFQQHNIVIAYRYKIEKKWFKQFFEN